MGKILKAEVISGFGKGRKIGFPTINLKKVDGKIPENGIYVVKCWINEKEYSGVGSVSDNPTFKNKIFSIEIHLFDINKDLRGKVVKVKFLEKLRDEKKFKHVKGLRKQIAKDVEEARIYFKKERKVL